MKKRASVKRNALLTLSVLAIGCLGAATALCVSQPVQAATSTTQDFSVLGGSVRTGAPDGFRFVVQIKDSLRQTYGENAKYGVVMVPQSKADATMTVSYTNGAYKASDTDAVVIGRGAWWSDELLQDYGISTTYSAYSCAIVADKTDLTSTFPEDLYNTPIQATGFVITEGGETVYTEKMTRSIGYVATVESLSADYVANGRVDDIASKTNVTFSINGGAKITSTTAIAPVLKIGNIDATASSRVKVTYTSSAPDVIKVVDGKVQAIARGTATVTATVKVDGTKTVTASTSVTSIIVPTDTEVKTFVNQSYDFSAASVGGTLSTTENQALRYWVGGNSQAPVVQDCGSYGNLLMLSATGPGALSFDQLKPNTRYTITMNFRTQDDAEIQDLVFKWLSENTDQSRITAGKLLTANMEGEASLVPEADGSYTWTVKTAAYTDNATDKLFLWAVTAQNIYIKTLKVEGEWDGTLSDKIVPTEIFHYDFTTATVGDALAISTPLNTQTFGYIDGSAYSPTPAVVSTSYGPLLRVRAMKEGAMTFDHLYSHTEYLVTLVFRTEENKSVGDMLFKWSASGDLTRVTNNQLSTQAMGSAQQYFYQQPDGTYTWKFVTTAYKNDQESLILHPIVAQSIWIKTLTVESVWEGFTPFDSEATEALGGGAGYNFTGATVGDQIGSGSPQEMRYWAIEGNTAPTVVTDSVFGKSLKVEGTGSGSLSFDLLKRGTEYKVTINFRVDGSDTGDIFFSWLNGGSTLMQSKISGNKILYNEGLASRQSLTKGKDGSYTWSFVTSKYTASSDQLFMGKTKVCYIKSISIKGVASGTVFTDQLFGDSGNYYNYCPTAFMDGNKMHVWYCANQTAGTGDYGNIEDHVYYRSGTVNSGDKWSFSASRTHLLGPSSSGWDSEHVCDPSVVKGTFKNGSTTYSYLMAYLGCKTTNNCCNEIGFAVAQSPTGPWTKLTSINPIANWYSSSLYAADKWGFGQPSLVSVNQSGTVLLFYACGTASGTYTQVEEWNLSNLASPSKVRSAKVTNSGVKNASGAGDCINNGDFGYDPDTGRLYCIKEDFPYAGSNYITCSNTLIYTTLGTGYNFDKLFAGTNTWATAGVLTQSVTGSYFNHNAALVTDAYGRIVNSKEIPVLYTVAGGTVAQGAWSSLSTYRIHGYTFNL